VSSIAWSARAGEVVGEAAKLPAFLRRDLLVAWSYRVGFFSDVASLVAQMLVFLFIGKLIDPGVLPTYGGSHPSYIEFVTLGLVVNMFVGVALSRMSDALRAEQMIGTLEALMTTPTAAGTVQLGSAAFDLVYMPLRTGVFLAFMWLVVGLDLEPSGILPALAVLLSFIPFVWGLGITTAAAILTFRRGQGILNLGTVLAGLASGAFFPLSVLPGWLATIAEYNPLAIAIDATRDALLGGTGWSGVGGDLLVLVPLAAISLAIGTLLFRAALRRERRRGTLGLY
jgi:ABC-2 type transport system permease protein